MNGPETTLRLPRHLASVRNRLRYGVGLVALSLLLSVGVPALAQDNDNHPPPCRVCHPMPKPTSRPAPQPSPTAAPTEHPTVEPAEPEGDAGW